MRIATTTTCSCATARLRAMHNVETGSPDARYAIVERRRTGWHAALIAVPYDHRSMAALARRNGRNDWECFQATGYVSAAPR